MKLFPKILMIIGFVLFILGALTPNNYSACHSDLIIAGYNDTQSCLPDVVYQFGEVSFFVGIVCIFASFYINEKPEKEEPIISIL